MATKDFKEESRVNLNSPRSEYAMEQSSISQQPTYCETNKMK